MMIFYTCDNEGPAMMELDTLIRNFNDTCAWDGYRASEADMRDELATRGWYENCHDNGRYLVLDVAKFPKQLRPVN